MNGKTIMERHAVHSIGCACNVQHDDLSCLSLENSLLEAIDAALAQARAEEREACARLVEEALVPQDCDTDDMKQLAEDIRARTL